MTNVVLGIDMVAQPVKNLMPRWGLDPGDRNDQAKVNTWCLTGKVPGAFKGPDGTWWVNPILMLRWGEEDGVPEGQRLHRKERRGA